MGKTGIGSFRLTGAIHVFEKSIQLPRLGTLRLKEHGYLPVGAKVAQATVSECAGRWYVSIQVAQEVAEPHPATGPAIGVDLGIKTLAAVSDGREIPNPKALHKATASLVTKTKPAEMRAAVIGIEDLGVSGMLKNRKLARAIADVGLSEFRRLLTYKAEQAGVQVHVVSRWDPSSKTCSGCGWYHADLQLADRIFVCQECRLVIDRDLNAARNLELLAYLELMSTVSYAGFDGSGQGGSGFSAMGSETALVE
jgi:putative transposase